MPRRTQDAISEALDRAQKCWDATVGVGSFEDPPSDRIYVSWFIHHVTVVVLLENLRRLDPMLAERLTGWLDGMFEDGYAGELLYQWRQQAAAGQPLSPISPGVE